MDEQKIKSAIKSQLDSIELNEQLKEKTIQSIKHRTVKSRFLRGYLLGSGISLAMTCLIAIILINPLKKSEPSPEPIAMLEGNSAVHIRQIEMPLERLKQVFNQLNLTYKLGTTQSETDYTVIPIEIEQIESYYVELSTIVDNSDLCLDSSYLVIQLNEKSFFFYAGTDDELIKSLANEGTRLCR
ncbi:MAG: hypothetical protein Q4Q00_04030 [Turicibacter sp.]|nr:hypothetical protein [Turicibacter sp.]